MNRHTDFLTAVVLLACTIVLGTLIWFRTPAAAIQRMDDAFLRQMVSIRSQPLTDVAQLFNVLGLLYVTLPVRLAAIAYLAAKRRWWHAAAFVGAMVASEVLIGSLKALYGRARPPGSLVITSGGSFPSGHAVAASVTAVSLVIALFPPGPRRWWWGVAAALFSFVMALSRAYLAAHWLSDAVAGTLLGTTVALCAALLVQAVRERRESQGPPPDDLQRENVRVSAPLGDSM